MKTATEMRRVMEKAMKAREEERQAKINSILADIEDVALEAALMGKDSIKFELIGLPLNIKETEIMLELGDMGYETHIVPNGIEVLW